MVEGKGKADCHVESEVSKAKSKPDPMDIDFRDRRA